jgi:hypothetical protein
MIFFAKILFAHLLGIALKLELWAGMAVRSDREKRNRGVSGVRNILLIFIFVESLVVFSSTNR